MLRYHTVTGTHHSKYWNEIEEELLLAAKLIVISDCITWSSQMYLLATVVQQSGLSNHYCLVLPSVLCLSVLCNCYGLNRTLYLCVPHLKVINLVKYSVIKRSDWRFGGENTLCTLHLGYCWVTVPSLYSSSVVTTELSWMTSPHQTWMHRTAKPLLLLTFVFLSDMQSTLGLQYVFRHSPQLKTHVLMSSAA